MSGDQSVNGGVELEPSADPAEADVLVLSDGPERFNRTAAVGGDRAKIPIAVWMREGGRLYGGAYGDTHYGWLYLSLLWVDEARRGQGWGGVSSSGLRLKPSREVVTERGWIPIDSKHLASTSGRASGSSAGSMPFLRAQPACSTRSRCGPRRPAYLQDSGPWAIR